MPEALPHAAALSPADIRRAVLASVIGNALEWFDFLIYGSFAAVIGAVFFPSSDPTLSQILVFATFGVGFVVRPFGGILIGMYADRAGRQRALSLLIVLMAAGTVALGLTPSYASIGIGAPIIIVAARILQGISVGGEFASATAMLVEYAPPSRKLFYGSFQMVSQSFAVTFAAGCAFLLTALLSPAHLHAWGWRLPFLLGGLVGPIGFYIRRRVAESPEFVRLRQTMPARQRAPIALLLGHHLPRVLCAIGVILAGTASTYLWNFYLPVYATHTLGLPATAPLLGVVAGGLLGMIINPLSGKLADRVGAYAVFLPPVILAGVLALPMFAFIVGHPTRLNLFALQVGATLVLGWMAGPMPGLLAGMFPTEVRSTGMALSYNVSVTLFGGLAPFTVTFITRLTHSSMSPAYYLTAAAALSLILVLGFRPREMRAQA